MLIRTVLSPRDLVVIGESIGVSVVVSSSVMGQRNWKPLWKVRLRLFPVCDLFRRISADGKRINAVCWHGNLQFLERIYRLDPDAYIRTVFSTYKSARDLEKKKMDSYNSYVVRHPVYYRYGDMCLCHDS